jgi:hypothetical protein
MANLFLKTLYFKKMDSLSKKNVIDERKKDFFSLGRGYYFRHDAIRQNHLKPDCVKVNSDKK